MKKLLIILCLLCFMVDMADDGYVYTLKLVAPYSSSRLVAAHQQAPNKSGKAFFGGGNLTVTLLESNLLNIPAPLNLQPLATGVPQAGKIILCRHLCGSGGLSY